MADSRIRRQSAPFAQVPNDLLRDERLTMEARGFMALLLTYADDWRFNRAHLERVSGLGKTKWERVIGELKGIGYLAIEREAGTPSFTGGWVWDLRHDAIPPKQGDGDTLETGVRPYPQNEGDIRIPSLKKTNFKNEGPAPSEPDLFQVIDGGRKDPEKEEGKKDPEVASAFDRFWAAYPAGPRKTDKPKARVLFEAICAGKHKGIPKTDPETIIAGAVAYAATGPGEYLKMPTGWLNGARWEQDALALPPGPAKSDVDLCLGFVEELRGRNMSALPHDLWNKLQTVKEITAQFHKAGMVAPWEPAARRQA